MQRCRAVDNRGAGIWYDIGNEQAEVSHCYIADNDEAGIFYEISYSLHAHDNLIVNNANHGESRAAPGAAAGSPSPPRRTASWRTTRWSATGTGSPSASRAAHPAHRRRRAADSERNHIIRNNLVACSRLQRGALDGHHILRPASGGHDKNDPIFEDPKTLNFRFENNLLFPLPGRPNYLYGCAWRPKSKRANTAAEFTAASGIADTSRVADPRFTDLLAHDFRLLPDSPATQAGRGRAGPRADSSALGAPERSDRPRWAGRHKVNRRVGRWSGVPQEPQVLPKRRRSKESPERVPAP